MAATRRGVLGFIAASPFVGKKATEEVAMQLMQGSPSPTQPGQYARYNNAAVGVSASPNRTPKDFARAFLDPKFKSAMEAASFRNNRHITHIDHDIASKRSFSLAAKITFQRQRNVERELSGYTEKSLNYWEVIENYFNPFGMKG